MTPSWQETIIDGIKANKPNAIAMGPFGSRMKTDNFVDSGVPVIRGVNINAERFNGSDDDFVFLIE
jgi:type I restriction enzyme S subunit